MKTLTAALAAALLATGCTPYSNVARGHVNVPPPIVAPAHPPSG